MLSNVKVSPLTKISERDLYEALEDVAEAMSRSGDELEREIDRIIAVSRYGNRDADNFFQVAADVCCYAYEQAYEQRRDINRDRDARKAMIDVMINMAVAVFTMDDKELSDKIDDRTYDEFKDVVRDYDDMLRYMGGNKGGSRGVSSGRRPQAPRGRDTGMTEEIADRRSLYRGGNRSDRRGGSAGASQPRRPMGRPEPEPVETRPSRPNRSPAYSERLEGSSRTSAPIAHKPHVTEPEPVQVPTESPEVRLYSPKANPNMEKYEAHELRSLQRHSDLKVIPMIDFTTIPPLDEKYEDGNVFGVKEITVPYNVFCGNCVPVNPEIAFKGKEFQVITYRSDQYVSALMPAELASVFEPALNENIGSFDRWWAVLTTANAEIAKLKSSDSVAVPQCINFVRFINNRLTDLINDMMCIVFGPEVSLRSFVDNYDSTTDTNTCRNYLYLDENADELRLFQELQTELLRHNFAFVPKIEIENMDAKYVIDDTEEYNQVWFRQRNIIVTFKDTLLGDNLVITDNDPVKIDRNYAEAFHDVCSDIVSKRANGLTMATIFLTDTYGNAIKLIAGKHRGGNLIAKLIEGWK